MNASSSVGEAVCLTLCQACLRGAAQRVKNQTLELDSGCDSGPPNHEAALLSKGHHHGFCKSRSGAGVHPTSLQNTTENMFQNIHRRSLLPALGPARRYPRPRNHRKRTLIRFQTCISCTPCAAATAWLPGWVQRRYTAIASHGVPLSSNMSEAL